MFYYKVSKKPKIEVRISSVYTKADLDRIFLFLDALVDSPMTKVIFKVNSSVLEEFTKTFLTYRENSLYEYKIENYAAL